MVSIKILKYLCKSYASIYLVLACPCHTDCLDGCIDCENLICSCKDDTNGKNLDACAAEQSDILGNCTLGCYGDTDCQLSCLETFETNYSKCPCQKNCPLGCPCPEYECKIEKEMAILVLSTQQSTNKPVLLLPNGNLSVVVFIYRTVDRNVQVVSTTTWHSNWAKTLKCTTRAQQF